VPYESSALLGSMGMFREMAGSPEDTVSHHLKSRSGQESGLRSGIVGGASSS